MLYTEFLTLTNRKVSYNTYTNRIEPAYMNSPLNKQEFCSQYIEQTKRTRKNNFNTNEFNKDKMIKATTFKTALKHLSKMVQENDGDVFYISDIIYQIEEGIKKWNNIINENNSKEYEWQKLHLYELEKLATTESNNEQESYKTVITNCRYYNFWQIGDEYFRLQIELQEGGIAYIDCGYKLN